MKKSLRAFGIGLFVAGASMTLVEQFSSNSDEMDGSKYEQQLKEYEDQITALREQLDQFQTGEVTDNTTPVESEPTSIKKTESDNKPSKLAEQNSTEGVVEATIYIYENVSIYTIGQQAEDLGIVANGRELELYLAKPEYSRSIQKGAFDLRSDMTIEEIAKVLTGQPID